MNKFYKNSEVEIGLKIRTNQKYFEVGKLKNKKTNKQK